MSLRKLLSRVLPEFPEIRGQNEVDVLQEIPVETLYLALKSADTDLALWFFENARPTQVQGLIDLDCWTGDHFQPERFENFFRMFSLLSPQKIWEYMKDLDAEIIVRGLLEYLHVEDYDPQNPPDYPDEAMMLSPDNKYLLVLKTDKPGVKEAFFLWLNKFSSMDLELMRLHLESCKWEQISDLEEYAFQNKKGRLEEMGFVDRTEALSLYSVGRAPDLKQKLLKNPFTRDTKSPLKMKNDTESYDYEQDSLSTELLPAALNSGLLEAGFLRDSFAVLPVGPLREAIFLELLRTVNAALSADDLMQKDFESISEASGRSRRYIDLGLSYLADDQAGRAERGAELLRTQPMMEIYRLGWLVLRDMLTVVEELRKVFPKGFFHPLDEKILNKLSGRHPELDLEELQILGSNSKTLVSVEASYRLGNYLAQLAPIGKFFAVDLGVKLELSTRPLQFGDNVFARLFTALFRQSCGQDFAPSPLTLSEFLKLKVKFDQKAFSDSLKVLSEKAPAAAQILLQKRLELESDELLSQLKMKHSPDTRFFRVFNWRDEPN